MHPIFALLLSLGYDKINITIIYEGEVRLQQPEVPGGPNMIPVFYHIYFTSAYNL